MAKPPTTPPARTPAAPPPPRPRTSPPALAHQAETLTGVVDSERGLRVAPTAGKGRGVYATRAFARGERVEAVPVLLLRPDEQDRLDGTVLDSYVFAWRDTVAIALGFGSIYNHSWDPNLEYQKRFDQGVIEFVAIRDIAAGDELTTNYTASRPDRPDLWVDLT
jgi:SET domain-containing protein